MENIDYGIEGLNRIFSEGELTEIRERQIYIISILNYFATSLFDKNTIDEVL